MKLRTSDGDLLLDRSKIDLLGKIRSIFHRSILIPIYQGSIPFSLGSVKKINFIFSKCQTMMAT